MLAKIFKSIGRKRDTTLAFIEAPSNFALGHEIYSIVEKLDKSQLFVLRTLIYEILVQAHGDLETLSTIDDFSKPPSLALMIPMLSDKDLMMATNFASLLHEKRVTDFLLAEARLMDKRKVLLGRR